MEEQMLPSIKDMYNCTRENYDYNVIRKYEGDHKNLAVNSKPTKKDHYLDWSTRLNCSPGPASTTPYIKTLPTKFLPGPARTPSSAKELRKKHTSMRLPTDRKKITVLHPATTQLEWVGLKGVNN